MNNRNWQNCIRHNLTMNKSFIKETDNKGSYWTFSNTLSKAICKKMPSLKYQTSKPSVTTKKLTKKLPAIVSNGYLTNKEIKEFVIPSHSPPSNSNVELIEEALNSHPQKMLVYSDIIQYVGARYPSLEMNIEAKDWKENIRYE